MTKKILLGFTMVAVLFVTVACDDWIADEPTTTTTTVDSTTTTSFDTLPGYDVQPLPRNGWSVEQGAELRERVFRVVDPVVVSSQPDVMNCTVDWFIELYTPQEIFEFGDDELIAELSTEGVAACGHWMRVV